MSPQKICVAQLLVKQGMCCTVNAENCTHVFKFDNYSLIQAGTLPLSGLVCFDLRHGATGLSGRL